MRHVLDWLEHDRPRYWKVRSAKPGDAVTEARPAPPSLLDVSDQRRAAILLRRACRAEEGRGATGLLHREVGTLAALDPREVRHEKSEYQGRISQMKDVVEIDVPQAMAILDRLMSRTARNTSRFSRPRRTRLVASAASESFARELMPRYLCRPTATPNELEHAAAESPPSQKAARGSGGGGHHEKVRPLHTGRPDSPRARGSRSRLAASDRRMGRPREPAGSPSSSSSR